MNYDESRRISTRKTERMEPTSEREHNAERRPRPDARPDSGDTSVIAMRTERNNTLDFDELTDTDIEYAFVYGYTPSRAHTVSRMAGIPAHHPVPPVCVVAALAHPLSATDIRYE